MCNFVAFRSYVFLFFCSAIKQEDVPVAKKMKKDETEEDDPREKEIKKQNDIMYKYRDELKANLKKTALQQLLEFNSQDIPPGEEAVSF